MQRKEAALRAIQDASLFLREHYRIVRTGIEKEDGSLVSEADTGSEQRIMQALGAAFPEDGFISEESPEAAGKSGYRWILDPLDGTHNFLAIIPLFGILLALEKGGEVLFSICCYPVLEETFVAERGAGAFRNGERIRVSTSSSLKGSVFMGDANSDMEFSAIMQDFRPFHGDGCRFRYVGQGAFGLTRVAMGSILAASRRGKIWDIAAPCLLVEEAGGTITDLQGRPWDLQPRPLIATNGVVHDAVLSRLASSR